MKATKDNDGKVTWEHENENPDTLFTGKAVEKVIDKPGRLDAIKEKSKKLSSQEQETEGL